jgi:hypothetical protein
LGSKSWSQATSRPGSIYSIKRTSAMNWRCPAWRTRTRCGCWRRCPGSA